MSEWSERPDPGDPRGDTGDRCVVVGAGTMGLGIAYVAAGAGYTVELVEVDPARAGAARGRLVDLWDRAVGRGRLTADAAAANRARLTVVGGLGEVADGPDVIVEAVPERLDLKRAVLREAAARRPVLLGSNTSSIPIAELAEGLEGPERFLGLHFFNPVWAMALLEIVVGPATAGETTTAAVALARRLGKDPVVVRDLPGFATSRLGVTLGLEAIRMLADGVASAADIDKAMVLGYRHPVGPLELTDLVGLDVRLDIARTLQAAYGDRFAPPPLLVELVAAGRLGKKSGHGFYRWVDGSKVEAPADPTAVDGSGGPDAAVAR
ncbi:3-hydroxyacyl-CoA dehydrogenase family protein [Micromonospora fluostatini]|uniref:3-hydroxyacyl-CoA dehydrogenase family protein n=1 Tax=Micromonospora sp. JCM 30529 TaxID=3421643 RepID=UPI003D185597